MRLEQVDGADALAEMILPSGETCGQCAHFARCSWAVGAKPHNSICDFYPSRFQSALLKAVEAQNND